MPEASWQPATPDVDGLGPEGRALLDRLTNAFDASVIEGEQVLEACRAADVLAQLRAAPDPDLRQIRLWSTYFTQLLRALGLS